MARKYWFKAHRHGFGWTPDTWQAWLIFVIYLVGLFYSYTQISDDSYSFNDTLINFLPKFFIFSALLLAAAYLKGEPTTWRWGDKK